MVICFIVDFSLSFLYFPNFTLFLTIFPFFSIFFLSSSFFFFLHFFTLLSFFLVFPFFSPVSLQFFPTHLVLISIRIEACFSRSTWCYKAEMKNKFFLPTDIRLSGPPGNPAHETRYPAVLSIAKSTGYLVQPYYSKIQFDIVNSEFGGNGDRNYSIDITRFSIY